MAEDGRFSYDGLWAPKAARPTVRGRGAGGTRIDFAGGRPDPASFPYEELAEAARRVLARDGAAALNYGEPLGFSGLRELLAEKYRRDEGARVEADNFLVTNGSAHALQLIVEALVEPGDPVICEAPTWMGAVHAFRVQRAEVFTVDLQPDGMDLDQLEETLRRLKRQGRRPKFIYTIPTFQNPVGLTMSLPKRQRLLGLALEYGTPIIEDDAYGDLRFEGEPQPSLLSLDASGAVIKLGTVSKILAAGLRLGWIIAPKEVIAHFLTVKLDGGTNPFVSRVAAEYLREHMDRHIGELIEVYRRKRDAMLATLGEYAPPGCVWTRPEGGFFLWLQLPAGTSLGRLSDLCARNGVGFMPGTACYPDGRGEDAIRLAYSFPTVEEIGEGTRLLCQAIRQAGE